MKLDEKAVEAALHDYQEEAGRNAVKSGLEAAIRAYLSALPSSPVSELVERLRETHTCDGCGEYAGSIIHDLCEEAASTLTTRNAELEREVKRLREALKGLVDLNNDYSPFGGELYQDRLDRAWDRAKAALTTSSRGGEHE